MDYDELFASGVRSQQVKGLEGMLASAREKNDALQPEMATAAVRGEIVVYKRLLGLLTQETTQVVQHQPAY